jgi:hypothetical protein
MPFIDAISPCGPAVRPAARCRSRLLHTAERDLLYVLAVLPLSIAGFTILVTGVSVAVSLAVLVVGALAWLGTIALVRVAADWDRRLAGWYRGARITSNYSPTRAGELWPTLRTVSRDRQTWRDLGWVAGNSTLGFVTATAAVTLSGLVLGLITTPAWWWAIPHPSQQYATLNVGLYTVTSTSLAFVNAALGLMLLPVAAAVNHWAASGHARLAARFLGAGQVPA